MRDFDVVAAKQNERWKPVVAKSEFDMLLIAKRNLDGFQQVVTHRLIIFSTNNSQ